jgi:hypothetical protein
MSIRHLLASVLRSGWHGLNHLCSGLTGEDITNSWHAPATSENNSFCSLLISYKCSTRPLNLYCSGDCFVQAFHGTLIQIAEPSLPNARRERSDLFFRPGGSRSFRPRHTHRGGYLDVVWTTTIDFSAVISADELPIITRTGPSLIDQRCVASSQCARSFARR